MIQIYRLSALILFLLFSSTSAFADIDQLCLKQCVNNGGYYATCLPGCSYGPDQTTIAAKPAIVDKQSAHSVLNTPVPVPEDTVLPVRKAAPPIPNKDYMCLQQCAHNGTVYSLCEQRCTKSECTTGASLCTYSQKLVNSTAMSQTTLPPVRR